MKLIQQATYQCLVVIMLAFFFSFYSETSKVFFLLGEREYLSVVHLLKITVSSDIKV